MMHNMELSKLRKRLHGKTIDELFEIIQVIPQEDMLQDAKHFIPVSWAAVTTDEGIISYMHYQEAFRYRLDLINQVLNG